MCELKKNERRGANVVDVHPSFHRGLDVRETVGQREREFLDRRRTGFADVIAGNGDRVPARHLRRAELHHVDDDADVRTRREDPFFLGDVFLENVGLQRAAQLCTRNALALRRRDVFGEGDRGRPVNRHRRRNLSEVDPVEEHLHVAHRVDRDAAPSDLAARLPCIGVVAHERRHVEGDREPRLAL